MFLSSTYNSDTFLKERENVAAAPVRPGYPLEEKLLRRRQRIMPDCSGYYPSALLCSAEQTIFLRRNARFLKHLLNSPPMMDVTSSCCVRHSIHGLHDGCHRSNARIVADCPYRKLL